MLTSRGPLRESLQHKLSVRVCACTCFFLGGEPHLPHSAQTLLLPPTPAIPAPGPVRGPAEPGRAGSNTSVSLLPATLLKPQCGVSTDVGVGAGAMRGSRGQETEMKWGRRGHQALAPPQQSRLLPPTPTPHGFPTSLFKTVKNWQRPLVCDRVWRPALASAPPQTCSGRASLLPVSSKAPRPQHHNTPGGGAGPQPPDRTLGLRRFWPTHLLPLGRGCQARAGPGWDYGGPEQR